MRLSPRLLLFSLVFLTVGCGFINRKITGQVFIATEGGTTYKLALVKIYVFKKKDVLQALEQARPFIEKAEQGHSDQQKTIGVEEEADKARCNELNSEIANQKAKILDAQAQYDALGKKIVDLLTKALAEKKDADAEQEGWNKKMDSGNSSQIADAMGSADKNLTDCTALTNDSLTMKTQADGLKAKFTDLGKARDAAVNTLQEEISSRTQFSNDLDKQKSAEVSLAKEYDETESKVAPFGEALNLSSALASTTTDADGNFALAAPRGEQRYLIAQAERTTGESKEYYFWVVAAVQDSVSLNNSNLAKCSSLADSLAANDP